MHFVYLVELKHKKELEAALTADPYADDSFARLGYTLKESQTVGLKGGSVALYFKCEDASRAEKLKKQIATVPSLKEASDEEKEKVVEAIEKELDSAASGFGSIFS